MVNPFSGFLWFGVYRLLSQRGKETASLILHQPMHRRRYLELSNFAAFQKFYFPNSTNFKNVSCKRVKIFFFWQLGSSCSFSSLHTHPLQCMDFQLIRDSQGKNFKTSVIILIWFVLAKGNV